VNNGKAESDGVEVRESPIQGLGVFALHAFRCGERIRQVNIVREVTGDSPLLPEAGERVEHCAYPSGKVVLWGFPDRHYNHSCDPNAFEQPQADGAEIVHVVARRDIERGQEITIDYSINIAGGMSWPCSCGEPRCRGETVGDYFKLPLELQLEYLPHLADWFVARHEQRVRSLKRYLAADK
jgi:hypothetical protein